MSPRKARDEPQAPAARIEQVGTDTHTWIIGDDEEVIVVDPGADASAVLDAVGEREVAAVICTHGHASHVAAAVEVAERDEAPVALHPADRNLWREELPDDDPDIDMEDGGIFEIAGASLEVLHAPGHSPGSVCLYSEELDAVFTGDVLSAGGPVPHDGAFPDLHGQLNSINVHLLRLPGSTRVLPGHGDELTIARAEKRFDSWVSKGGRRLLTEPEEDEEAEDEEPEDDVEAPEPEDEVEEAEEPEDEDEVEEAEDSEPEDEEPEAEEPEDAEPEAGEAKDKETEAEEDSGPDEEAEPEAADKPAADNAGARRGGRGPRRRQGRKRGGRGRGR